MRGRWVVHLGVLALLAAVSAGPVRADGWTRDDTVAALADAPYMVQCIVRLESSYEPYAVGAAGEQGVAQLLPGGGQWEPFWTWDWTDVPPAERSTWDPYLSVQFLSWWGERYGYRAWTTARYC